MRPELLHIGSLTIYSWGVFFSIGFVSALFVALRLARRYGLNEDRIFDLVLLLVAAGLAGGRILHVVLNWPLYAGASPLQYVAFWDGGLSWYGGLGGALLAGWLFTRATRLNFLATADIIAPPLSLAYAITRIGCFLAGCCYGHETSLPIGVVFPGLGGPRHPTQLYSSAINFAIFFVLLAALRRKRFDGQVFLEYIIYYSAYRFVIEFFREGPMLFGPFTLTQPLALLGLVLGALLLAKLSHRKPGPAKSLGGGGDDRCA